MRISGEPGPTHNSRRIGRKLGPKIIPIRIAVLDELNFPTAQPALDPLLARDRFNDVAVDLKIDERLDLIFFGEPWNEPFPVLLNSALQIIGHANK